METSNDEEGIPADLKTKSTAAIMKFFTVTAVLALAAGVLAQDPTLPVPPDTLTSVPDTLTTIGTDPVSVPTILTDTVVTTNSSSVAATSTPPTVAATTTRPATTSRAASTSSAPATTNSADAQNAAVLNVVGMEGGLAILAGVALAFL